MSVKQACRDIKQLNPLAQQACNLFLAECKKQGANIFITETYRSQARQNWLYEQGRTRKGQVVTWTRNSNHTGRMAWDIAVSPPSKLYDRNIITKAGRIADKLGIEWGGNWKTPDMPHFQINSNWKMPKGVHKVEKTKINLNGKIKEVDTVRIDGNNYIKLRDLADNKIVVDYDSVRKLPIVTLRKTP